ncbi:beta-glucosidase [Gilliamella apicola]|uniref:Periplasmic beta-glucosidase n=1 Tax=Gilliamella apicola TaxID=1196095 RepID=A0A242NN43_9GAMM|nr:beta-glucosidase BglX [Gilliamella apicola]OTP83032.1 beta-glucosidase [Gilliamella apicola]OTP85647.1 beta-glucosidase [Gilliamella apicola]OTQ01713.1 beta-glucosidase [Gilliamella apicola]OTQ11187.1 beta-glucosidase [Gilliamella apicola]OTQ15153.1 beta-glucosidase [Gilliamella apicola]
MIKKITVFLFFIAFSGSVLAQQTNNEEKKRFIDDLLSKMTIEEKVGQLRLISVGDSHPLNQTLNEIEAGEIGGIFNTIVEPDLSQMQDRALKSPNKIPLLLGFDIIHGHRTVFPINLGIAATWDRNAIGKVAQVSADEATSDGLNITWAPMVDITRDPRWGRVSEGFGEDPYLTSEAGRIFVEKMQKQSLKDKKSLVTSVKHFALYGAVEGGREYNSTDMSERKMFQEYLVPYKAAIDAGSRAVMVSLVSVNGIPATANHWLLTEVLRDKWHFNGVVVSDHGAIRELINHGVASDPKDAVRVAINAGIDMSMNDEYFLKFLPQLIKEGAVTETRINQACRHVLELKYDMGLFSDPHRNLDPKLDIDTMFADNRLHRQEAREVARRSIVLLKNNNNVLPISKNAKIAVVGPLADSKRDILGSWSAAGRASLAVTPLEGIKHAANNAQSVDYAFGANLSNDANLYRFLNLYAEITKFDNRPADKMITEAVDKAKKADVVIAFVGEAQGMAHESSSRTDISLPASQKQLIKALKATGKPLVIALMNGRPLTLTEEYAQADAMLETWYLGTEGGNAIADVLFGDYNPSGKLPMSFPYNVGQIPVYYSHLNTGRPRGTENMGKYTTSYFDSPNEPLFPFGFGLSYTDFNIDFVLSSTEMTKDSEIVVTANIENIGDKLGTQTVQLYLQDITASVSRPVKQLVGFENITLKPHEKGQVKFVIKYDMLKFWNDKMQYVAEPGKFNVFVGSDSTTQNKQTFILLDK